jgi:DNA-binding transcriptional LysR family regulator
MRGIAMVEPGTRPSRSQSAVELRHLRAFVAVAEECNFTRAAGRLSVTQPALSRTIAQLEHLVGACLLRRTPQGVQLTTQGERFEVHARRTLHAVQEAFLSATDQAPLLRVGLTWGAAAAYTAPVVRAFERENPHVVVELRRYDDELAGLADGRTHISFLPGPPLNNWVETLVLAREPRIAALPVGHKLAALDELQLRQLADETIIINVVSGTTSLGLWEPTHAPSSTVEVQNVDEWLEAVAAGRGVGLTPASTGRLYHHPEITYRLISDAPLVSIVLAWSRVGAHPLVENFVAIARRMRSSQADGGQGYPDFR